MINGLASIEGRMCCYFWEVTIYIQNVEEDKIDSKDVNERSS